MRFYVCLVTCASTKDDNYIATYTFVFSNQRTCFASVVFTNKRSDMKFRNSLSINSRRPIRSNNLNGYTSFQFDDVAAVASYKYMVILIASHENVL